MKAAVTRAHYYDAIARIAEGPFLDRIENRRQISLSGVIHALSAEGLDHTDVLDHSENFGVLARVLAHPLTPSGVKDNIQSLIHDENDTPLDSRQIADLTSAMFAAIADLLAHRRKHGKGE